MAEVIKKEQSEQIEKAVKGFQAITGKLLKQAQEKFAKKEMGVKSGEVDPDCGCPK